MAFKLPFKLTKTQIGLILSLLLNLLGGTGQVQPFIGGELPDCPAQTVDASRPSAEPPVPQPAAPAAN